MSKLLLHNEQTGELVLTNADVNKPKFASYIKNGFKPLGYVWGMNVGIAKLDTDSPMVKELLDKVEEIKKS